MNNLERFQYIFSKEKPNIKLDRLPKMEWATWWDKTINNWRNEGLPNELSWQEIHDYFNLDSHHQIWFPNIGNNPPAPKHHGAGIMENENDYYKLKKENLFKEEYIDNIIDHILNVKKLHDKKETAYWVTFDGFFMFPRNLFGIEPHLYSFYDYPELYHKICKDLLDFNLLIIEKTFKILTPDFITIAEDMSYNHGPMLSKETFYEFLAPYYKVLTKKLKEHNTRIFVDTDGLVTPMIDWLIDVGVEGILPLERQSKVDVNYICEKYPNFFMIGGFDKTVMSKGKEAMEEEFIRLLPAMKSKRFIPSVDHQTPPDVTMENYRIYLNLLDKYIKIAAN